MHPDIDPPYLPLIAVRMERVLRAQLFRITKDVDVSEDLLQDIHVKLLSTNAARIARPEAYISTLTTRVGLRWLKGQRDVRQISWDEFGENIVNSYWDPSPDQVIENAQLVGSILRRLPRHSARALLMRVEGRSIREIATGLGITVDAAKACLNEGLMSMVPGTAPERPHAGGEREPAGELLYSPPSQKDARHDVQPKVIVVGEAIAQRLKGREEALYSLSPREFEHLIYDIVRDKGHEAYLTPKTWDWGRDVLAYFESEICGKLLCLIETKRYARHLPVGVDMVQKLYGAFTHAGASCAMLVTTSSFTQPARNFQAQHKYQLSLKDYADVVKWIRDYGKV